mmetsp:Transcript_132306/g.382511  ORF Transcript_132306/g.382511 Transcript_132306/m.382511 type:complete len:253 (-) Transcript_132306:283-1041(-)
MESTIAKEQQSISMSKQLTNCYERFLLERKSLTFWRLLRRNLYRDENSVPWFYVIGREPCAFFSLGNMLAVRMWACTVYGTLQELKRNLPRPPTLFLWFFGLLRGFLLLSFLLSKDLAHEVSIFINISLVSVGKSQVKAAAIVKFTPNTELAANTKRSHGQGNATNFLRVAILIIQVRNRAIGSSLLPFVERILSLSVRLGLPRPHVLLLLRGSLASFFDLLEIGVTLRLRRASSSEDLLLLLPLVVETVFS